MRLFQIPDDMKPDN